MAKSKAKEIKWLPDVAKHDYPAAESYLRLIYADDKVATMVAKLRKAAVVQFKAKDIFINRPLEGRYHSRIELSLESPYPVGPSGSTCHNLQPEPARKSTKRSRRSVAVACGTWSR